MSATLKEIYDIDTQVEPAMNSWSTAPAGIELLIQEAPDFSLLIDDTNKLLIQ
jgi:hypothetical protein